MSWPLEQRQDKTQREEAEQDGADPVDGFSRLPRDLRHEPERRERDGGRTRRIGQEDRSPAETEGVGGYNMPPSSGLEAAARLPIVAKRSKARGRSLGRKSTGVIAMTCGTSAATAIP